MIYNYFKTIPPPATDPSYSIFLISPLHRSIIALNFYTKMI